LPDEARLHLERLSLRGVRCAVEPGGSVSLRCESARVGSVVLEQGGRFLQLRGVEWSSGFELQDDVLRWPELTLDRVKLALPELPRRRPSASASRAPSTERAGLSLPLLDHLEG